MLTLEDQIALVKASKKLGGAIPKAVFFAIAAGVTSPDALLHIPDRKYRDDLWKTCQKLVSILSVSFDEKLFASAPFATISCANGAE